ncbi:MAG: ABC transporter substrate-binding protein [Alphaproteobacteria bacterium]|nr:ABC transporter substrate-binding protein [Alphaproteobacteria bacterium]
MRATLTALGALLALALAGGQVQSQTKEKVSIAALPFVSSSPIFIAKELGYFDAEGLDLEIKIFNAAQPVAVATASGDTDFGITGLTGGFYNLAGKGALKIIAAQSREEPGYDFVAYVANPKAHEAGLRKPADLAGKTVGITTVGSTFHYNLGKLAEKHGFKLDSITLKPLQSIPNMSAALKGQQVDAILITANNAYQLEKEGAGKIIGWVHQETPWQLGALFTSTRMVEGRRATVEKFVRAYLKGTAAYAEAYLQKDASGKRVFGKKAEDLYPIQQKWVKPEPQPQTVLASANFIDPQGRLLVKDIYDQVAWYQAQGLVDKDVDPRKFLDLSFVQGHMQVPQN